MQNQFFCLWRFIQSENNTPIAPSVSHVFRLVAAESSAVTDYEAAFWKTRVAFERGNQDER